MLLIPPDLADQEDRVEHDAGDDKAEQQDAGDQQYAGAPVQCDPTDLQSNGDENHRTPSAVKKILLLWRPPLTINPSVRERDGFN